ncbi:MAG: CRISPR-associated endonuclease Cas1 [Desulfobacterales bacterium]|nr:CRISPR-associated endonuclease Cas1 [Desulfobacterales bacterium]
MSVLYISDQGAFLRKEGDRLVVQKAREIIQSVHYFKIDQIVLMGNISISPAMISFLLDQGIDTVFMSIYGRYRGRLISQFGKNIDLRVAQFRKMENSAVKLAIAKKYVKGKLENFRILLRKYNKKIQSEEIVSALNMIRAMLRQVDNADTIQQLTGMEGKGSAAYFGVFGKLIKAENIVFNGRNRRPPKDAVNVLLSLGYTLLRNAIQTQINIVGLDPFLACLHSVEYGRASLADDLMEEFRPVIVDPLVLILLNKKIIRYTDFYKPDEQEPAAFDFAEEYPDKNGYPIILTHTGMKKFITHFSSYINQTVLYLPQGKMLTYKNIFLEQVRLLARQLKDEDEYTPYIMR